MPTNGAARKWGGRLLGLLAVAGLAAGGWFAVGRGKPAHAGPPSASPTKPAAPSGVPVEVAAPRPGGTDRVCVQPGTVEPFEAADLFAKVSGFLVEQRVDIGDAVKAGDVLARIAVPELDAQVRQDTADVARAAAKVDQMTAAIATAEAEQGAAAATVSLARAEQGSKASYRAYREKQRDRIRGLAAQNAIDAKLVDEQEDQYQAAAAAELAAGEAVAAARQKEAAAAAKVAQARADRRLAEAEVVSAKAKLERSQVMTGYAVIRSPYTGIVTRRSFHVGDFVRSADAGGERTPVLAVEKTDVMRVVVQVPERDVPFVDVGDPAVVEMDALPVAFRSAGAGRVRVSRIAASEDPHTRMMRVEVDVPNPDGRLRRGMYGRVALTLQPGAAGAVRIPSAALSGKADGGRAAVRVVRDGVAHLVKVTYDTDDGSEVEVLSGLTPADRVVVRAAGPLDEGTAVAVSDAHAGG